VQAGRECNIIAKPRVIKSLELESKIMDFRMEKKKRLLLVLKYILFPCVKSCQCSFQKCSYTRSCHTVHQGPLIYFPDKMTIVEVKQMYEGNMRGHFLMHFPQL